MRAYNPGERWQADDVWVVRRKQVLHREMERCEDAKDKYDKAVARAKLNAESPERDELLREIEEWLVDELRVELNRLDDAKALLTRIRATVERTE